MEAVRNHTKPNEMVLTSAHNLCIEQISEQMSHYANKHMQYAVIFHSCKNDNFKMKNCNIFLTSKAKDRIAQKLLCFTHDLDTKHQR